MPMFRKKLVITEALQFTQETRYEAAKFVGDKAALTAGPLGASVMIIRTIHGDMRTHVGDWIIKGVGGEFYPCKPDIFDKTYEPVDP